MTKPLWLLVAVLTTSCSHYRPLYSNQHPDVSFQQIVEHGVSGFGEILNQTLLRLYPPLKAPKVSIDGTLDDVSILTSPIQPGSSATRAYKLRARLKLTLTHHKTDKVLTKTFSEETDFLLGGTDGSDQVLDTERNRKKAMQKLADQFARTIEIFIASELRT